MNKEAILEIYNFIHRGNNYVEFLCRLAQQMDAESIVELGTNIGTTTRQLAGACPGAIVYSIDFNTESQKHIQVEPTFRNIEFSVWDSVSASHEYKGAPIDLLFIDADHTLENTIGNYKAWLPLVRPGGIIVFDDLNLPGMEGVAPEIGEGLIRLDQLHHSGFGCIIKQ